MLFISKYLNCVIYDSSWIHIIYIITHTKVFIHYHNGYCLALKIPGNFPIVFFLLSILTHDAAYWHALKIPGNFFSPLFVYGDKKQIENTIDFQKKKKTRPRGWSGLLWLGKIRHHYAGNLLIFPLIFSRFFFQYSLLLSDPYTTTLPIRLNGSPCFFCIFWFVKPLSKFVKPF